MVSGRSLATGGLPASGGQDGSATAGRSRLARSPVARAGVVDENDAGTGQRALQLKAGVETAQRGVLADQMPELLVDDTNGYVGKWCLGAHNQFFQLLY
jgi:hypothetical protein